MSVNALHERLVSRIYVAPSGHWIWIGSLNHAGYGVAPMGKRGLRCLAHRATYEALVGPIPEGLEIDHLCRVRRCCNPLHLQAVTHQVNCARANLGRNNKDKAACPRCGGAYRRRRHDGNRFCPTCHKQAVARYRARLRDATLAGAA